MPTVVMAPKTLRGNFEAATPTALTMPDNENIEFRLVMDQADFEDTDVGYIKFQVYISDDGVTWRKRCAFGYVGHTADPRMVHGPGIIVNTNTIKDKYVKVEVTNSGRDVSMGAEVRW